MLVGLDVLGRFVQLATKTSRNGHLLAQFCGKIRFAGRKGRGNLEQIRTEIDNEGTVLPEF
jgi:hypothetical protein